MYKLVIVSTLVLISITANVIRARAGLFLHMPELVITADPLAKCCDETCSVVFSPDGAAVAAKLYHSDFLGDQGIVIWDVINGSLIKGIQGPLSGVYSIKFGPDAGTIGIQNGQICDLQNGKTFKLGLPEDRIYSIAFSPDGELIASSDGQSGTKITLWDAKNGNRLRVFTSDVKTGKELHFSRDGKTLVSAGRDLLQLWNIESGRVVYTIRPECGTYSLFAYSEFWNLLAITVCGDPDSHAIQLLDAGSGRLIGQLKGHTSGIWSLDLSSDGRFLASSGEDLTIRLWDIANGSLLRTFTGHSKVIRSVAFSPDERTIASGGGDNETKIWSISNGELIATLRAFKDGNWIVYTPDGYYNRSQGAAKYIKWRVGTKLSDETMYRSQFFRPEVVAERLQNKR